MTGRARMTDAMHGGFGAGSIGPADPADRVAAFAERSPC